MQHERHDHGPDRVEVRQRVERDAPKSICGVVALTASLPGVRDFVHHDRHDEDGDEKNGFHSVRKLTPQCRLIPTCVVSSFVGS